MSRPRVLSGQTLRDVDAGSIQDEANDNIAVGFAPAGGISFIDGHYLLILQKVDHNAANDQRRVKACTVIENSDFSGFATAVAQASSAGKEVLGPPIYTGTDYAVLMLEYH